MSTKIEFELAANDTSAKAAWERQNKAINGIIEKMGQLEGKSVSVQKTQDSWLSKGATQLAGMAAGYVSLTSVINGVISANREMMQQADETALRYDTAFRKMRLQGALNEMQGEAAKGRVLDIAQKYGFTQEETTAAATQLISSGFSVDQATGAALEEFIKGTAASNLQGQDSTRLAQSVTQLLRSQGAELNDKNLSQVMMGTQRLFQANNIQLSDLEQLAGKGLSYKGRASMPELLGMMTIGRDVLDAEKAATGVKIFGERLMGAKGDKHREEVLKSLKLKPEDVDMVGEGLPQVLERLDTAFKNVPEAKRAGLREKLFGTEAAGFAGLMMDNRGKLDTLVAQQADRAGFESAVDTAVTGKGAQTRRIKLMRDREMAERDTNAGNTLDAADYAAMKAGVSPFLRTASRGYANTMMALGFSPETATKYAYAGRVGIKADGSFGSFGGGVADETNRILQETLDVNKKMAADFKKAVEKPPVVIKKPDVPATHESVRAGVGK